MHCSIGLLACVLTRKVFARRKSFDEVGAVRIKGHVKTFDDPETHLHTGTEQLWDEERISLSIAHAMLQNVKKVNKEY